MTIPSSPARWSLHQWTGGAVGAGSDRTSRASSTGWLPSSYPTAAGTARPPTARCGRRSTPRSVLSLLTRAARRGTAGRTALPAWSLLERRLFRRRSTGAVIDYDRKDGPCGGPAHPAWTRFAFLTWWHYVLGANARAAPASCPRARSRGDGPGRVQGRWRRPVVAGGPVPRRHAGGPTRARAGRAGGTPARLTSVELVFGRRLA